MLLTLTKKLEKKKKKKKKKKKSTPSLYLVIRKGLIFLNEGFDRIEYYHTATFVLVMFRGFF